jgi:hypothetical protein
MECATHTCFTHAPSVPSLDVLRQKTNSDGGFGVTVTGGSVSDSDRSCMPEAQHRFIGMLCPLAPVRVSTIQGSHPNFVFNSAQYSTRIVDDGCRMEVGMALVPFNHHAER